MKKIQIEDTIYQADTDFRVAIECNRIAMDETIGDYERVLGIICTVFGSKGIDNPNHYERLIKWIKKWLSCGQDLSNIKGEPDMDYIEDEKYIRSSFKYDYKYNPYDLDFLEWEEFYNDLNNLSNSELGDCCILSRVRNLRNYDLSKIKDNKERQKIKEAKEMVALKRNKKENNLTKEQEKSMSELNKILGL